MQTKIFRILMLIAIASSFASCGTKDAAPVAAGTSTVTIEGSGSAN